VFISLNKSILFRLPSAVVFPGRQEDRNYILKEDDSKMNNEIKKNKKMVLALVIIAALAMVSVAAVAIHSDDSSAAGSGQYIPMDSASPFVIDGTITADYEFYTTGGPDALSIEITSNANYTGTMTIGTVDNTVNPWVYTPYASMKLTNVSNVEITANLDTTGIAVASFTLCNPITDPLNAAQINSDGVYELNEAPSGTFELLQGSVMLGVDKDNFFNGAVTAAGFTATSEYAVGAVVGISADGTAQISGDVQAGDWQAPVPAPAKWDAPTPTLTLSGAASIQLPDATQKLNDSSTPVVVVNDVLTTDGVDVTIADGAVITAGDRAPSLATSVLIDGTGINEGILFNADGFYQDVTPADSSKLIFANVPMGTYSLFIASDNGLFYGTMTVTPTATVLSSLNLPVKALPDDVFTSTGKDNLTFDAGAYTFMWAINLTTGESGTAKVDNAHSITSITFAKKGFDNDELLAVLKDPAGGLEVLWGSWNNNDANGLGTTVPDTVGLLKVTSVTGNLTDPAQIRANAPEVSPSYVNFIVKDDSNVHIFGTLNLLYVNNDQYGSFDISKDAFVDLNADGGMITQGVMPTATGSTGENPVGTIFASTNLVAAYYWTNDTSGTPTISTYYFTSLENAIKNSNTVTLVGDVVILKDTTLSSSNSDPLTVIIGPQATLTVGKKKVGDDPAISANLTIPSGTTLVNPSGNPYKVVNGQAIYDEKPTPASNEPTCDVLITGNNKYIYTDLATALDISTGNVTIDTLQIVDELNRSATVNTGVTLNDTWGITIPEDLTLTVNGTVNSTADMIITGTLWINNVVNFGKDSEITLNGSINIAKAGTLNLNGSTLNGAAKSVLVIDGTLNMTNGATGNVDTLYLDGTATITKLTVDNVLRIGAVPSLSTGYVNSASLTGKLTLGAEAVAWVYGDFNAKTAFDNPVAPLSTQYMIDTTLYLTIFVADGNTSYDLPMVYGDEFDGAGYMLDIAINDWNNNRMLRGDSLIKNPNGDAFVGNNNWLIVYADWSAKQYKVTFNYMPGVTWSCNGQTIDSNNNFAMVDYGASISVQVFVQPGYQGTPVIQKDGTAVSGNPVSATITGNVTFSVKDGSVQVAGTGTTDNNSSSGLSLIEILLIIIVIIIAIMAIIIAIRLLRS
jgi:hypothetical protein